jgi:hypothetical protein
VRWTLEMDSTEIGVRSPKDSPPEAATLRGVYFGARGVQAGYCETP